MSFHEGQPRRLGGSLALPGLLLRLGGSLALPGVMFLIVVASGCGDSQNSPSESHREPVTIAVTSNPLLWIAGTLAGDAATVRLVVPPETTSPEWHPGSDDVRDMQNASRILISGGGYEPWLQRVTLPGSRLIDTAEGYYGQFIRIPDSVVHQHGPEGGHTHPGTVWATWLDPRLLTSQVERVRGCLVALMPERTGDIQRAADKVTAQLEQLDELVAQIAQKTSAAGVVAVGDAPIYQYLTRRLGWTLEYAHLPATPPLTADDRDSLRELIRSHQPTVVLVRSAVWDDLAELRRDLDVPFVSMDLCESEEPDANVAERLSRNLTDLLTAVTPGP